MASEPQTVNLPEIMLQDYPLDTFPAWARDKVIDVCQRVQAAVPIAANLLLSLVSGCISRIVYVVTEDKQYEPTAIWTLTLAGPGERKTPVFRELIQPIMESEISEYLIGDITKASFIRRMAHDRKLIGVTDEPVLLDCLMDTTSIMPSALLNAYDETFIPYCRTIAGKIDTLKIRKPSLTLGIAGQPDVVNAHYNSRNGRRLSSSGFFARMLIVQVESMRGQRKTKRGYSCESESIAAAYNENMSSLANLEQILVEREFNNQFILELSPEANQRFLDFIDEWEEKLSTDEDYIMIERWINKDRGFVLRLAGILYMMELVTDEESEQCPPISVEIIERAIRLLEYYRDQMIRWHNIVDGEGGNPNAAYLHDFLIRREGNEWPKRDLRASLKHTKGLDNKDDFEAAIEELKERKVISVIQGEQKRTGGKRPLIVRLLKKTKK